MAEVSMKKTIFCVASLTVLFSSCSCPVSTVESQEPPSAVIPVKTIFQVVREGNLDELCRRLAENPELLDTMDAQRWTLMHHAATSSHGGKIIDYLVENGADIRGESDREGTPLSSLSSADGTLPVDLAIRLNHNPEVLRYLIKHTPNYHVSGPGLFPKGTQYNSNPAFMRILLENGADPNQNMSLRTPMHYAAAKSSNVEVLKTLYEFGGNVNLDPTRIPKDNPPNTPLHYAARSNPNVEISQWLVAQGADFRAKNGHGESPLDYAIRYNTNPEVIKFFLNISFPDGGSEPGTLDQALKWQRSPEIIRFLAEQIPDLTSRAKSLPFYRVRNIETAKILIEYGADIHAKNEWGYTIFDILEVEMSHDTLLEFLKNIESTPTK